jgi:hypothetical protein
MSHDLAAVVSRLSAKPWNAAGVAPSTLDTAIGMIGPEERRALWWLAREVLRDGAIVDAGSFLGASTFCLAAGAAASPHAAERKGPIVHAFDHFKAIDAYVAETISRQVRPTAPGDSYLDLFMAQVEPHASIIRAVPGDFLQARWDEGPIDLLFIDVAKSEALNAHVVGTMFPHLVPGESDGVLGRLVRTRRRVGRAPEPRVAARSGDSRGEDPQDRRAGALRGRADRPARPSRREVVGAVSADDGGDPGLAEVPRWRSGRRGGRHRLPAISL